MNSQFESNALMDLTHLRIFRRNLEPGLYALLV
jgi:hypothetical protein